MGKDKPPDIDARTEEETTDPNRTEGDHTTTPTTREKDYANRKVTNKHAADTPFIRRMMYLKNKLDSLTTVVSRIQISK